MDWLYVGGQAWQRTDDGPDTETGAGDDIPDDWPVAQQTIFGYATLVNDDLIEYSIGDGEVISTYAPATQPGCEWGWPPRPALHPSDARRRPGWSPSPGSPANREDGLVRSEGLEPPTF